MTLKAVVEKLAEQRYRAAIAQPFAMESEGATEEEAIDRLREMAIERLKSSKVVDITVPAADSENPLLKFAGVWKDSPDIDEFRRAIEEHRKEMDSLEIL